MIYNALLNSNVAKMKQLNEFMEVFREEIPTVLLPTHYTNRTVEIFNWRDF